MLPPPLSQYSFDPTWGTIFVRVSTAYGRNSRNSRIAIQKNQLTSGGWVSNVTDFHWDYQNLTVQKCIEMYTQCGIPPVVQYSALRLLLSFTDICLLSEEFKHTGVLPRILVEIVIETEFSNVFVAEPIQMVIPHGSTAALPVPEPHQPASQRAILALEQIVDLEPHGQCCSICRNDFISTELKTRLPCFHSYHRNCILPWLSRTNTCPLCRYQLPQAVEFEE